MVGLEWRFGMATHLVNCICHLFNQKRLRFLSQVCVSCKGCELIVPEYNGCTSHAFCRPPLARTPAAYASRMVTRVRSRALGESDHQLMRAPEHSSRLGGLVANQLRSPNQDCSQAKDNYGGPIRMHSITTALCVVLPETCVFKRFSPLCAESAPLAA